MPLNPDLSDYPPLTRAKQQLSEPDWTDDSTLRKGQKVAQDVSDADCFPDASFTHGEQPPVELDVSLPVSKETSFSDSDKPQAASTYLKRGHAIAFFGLFLFTTVVFFRPYEIFTSLRWTSASAFWIALATAVVFVPTQLGLEQRISMYNREVKLLLLLVIAALLSIPFALSPARAWSKFTEYLKVVSMFIVMINVVRTKGRLKALMLLCLAVSLVLSISAINDYRLGKLVVGGERIAGLVGGMFQNPNDLALHLVTMFPLAAAFFFISRNPLGKIIYAVIALILTAGVIATFSRGGFLGLALAVAVMFARLTRGSKAVFVGVLIAIVLAFLASGGFGSRLGVTSDLSYINRQDDLKRSIFLTARHPLFGLGMDNYLLYSNQGLSTHNAYTQVSSELGVFGGVCYVMFLVVPLLSLRRIQVDNKERKRKPWEYYLSIGVQASLVGYMVASFFASVAFLWYCYYLVGYAICLRTLYETKNPTVEEGPVVIGN